VVRIRSDVVRRFWKDGGEWFPDKDFVEIGIPVCQNLVKLINDQLSRANVTH